MTDQPASDRNQLLYRNARQIKRIVEATYSSPEFQDELSLPGSAFLDCEYLDNGEKLACLWNNAVRSMASESDGLKEHHLYKVGMRSARDFKLSSR